MIHTIRTVTVDSKKSVIDSPIVLYRGDREVEIEFSLVGSKFTFSEGGNVIKSLNAAYGQLIIHSPNPNIDIVFSEITECNDGKVVFLITKEMIDELVEVGTYDFQIRLYDATQVSRATIPPISQALDIRHPIGSEEETNVVDIAIAEYSIVRDDPFEDVMTFLPSGDYNKTEWSSNALITAARMNKIEYGLYTVNRNMEVSDTSLFNRIEKVNNNLSARLNNLGDEIATEAMDSFSDQIAQLKGTVNASILASETKVTAEMDATKESVNAELEALEETVNAELEAFEETFNANWESTRTTIEETKAAIDEAKVTVDETQSVVTELIDETRETVSSFEGRINALDAAYKAADVEIQNSIPTKTSQLENDAAYITEEVVAPNLIRNGIFAGKKTDYWWIFGEFSQYGKFNYYKEGDIWIANQKKRDISSWPGSRCGIFTNAISVEPGEVYTFSTQVLWEEKVEGIGVYIEFYYNGEYKQTIEYYGTNTNSGEREIFVSDITKRQTITFTVPSDINEVMVGLIHEGCFIEAPEGAYLVNFRFPCLKKGYSTEWTPHKYDICTQPGSGSWFNNGTPVVDGGGVMEIGKYLDFHSTNEGTSDHDARIGCLSNGYLTTWSHIHPSATNSISLGSDTLRFRAIYLNNGTNVSSDRTLKENITYVKSEKAKSVPTDEVVTYEDMYDFVKNDLELATYNFKGQEEQCMNFIAQDLLYNIDGTDNKVGQMIIKPVAPPTEEEIVEAKSKLEEGQEYTYPTLSYDSGMYTSVLAGALKEALNKIDKLEARIDELENK